MSDATSGFRLFSFSACNPDKTEVSYDTTEGGIGLEKDSALYQLMDTRMHSVMNGIVSTLVKSPSSSLSPCKYTC